MRKTAFLEHVTANVREVVDGMTYRFTVKDVYRELERRHPDRVIPRSLGWALSSLVKQGRIRVVGAKERTHACHYATAQYNLARVFETVVRASDAKE